MSTVGQGLETTHYKGEQLFSITLVLVGLILMALLIGNMQTYLQSMTLRLEEMRLKRRDSEQWMHHRVLPDDLRDRVWRHNQYKWLETRGVDEDSLVRGLPKDLRRDVKRHLCLRLVRRVPLFANMDERLLDAICERLKPSLCTESTYIVREGDPVDEMLFIIRGQLESSTTDGGRTGFYNRGLLAQGGGLLRGGAAHLGARPQGRRQLPALHAHRQGHLRGRGLRPPRRGAQVRRRPVPPPAQQAAATDLQVLLAAVADLGLLLHTGRLEEAPQAQGRGAAPPGGGGDGAGRRGRRVGGLHQPLQDHPPRLQVRQERHARRAAPAIRQGRHPHHAAQAAGAGLRIHGLLMISIEHN